MSDTYRVLSDTCRIPAGWSWCEVSEDFDLLVELIAHVLADQETSMLQVAHDQAVARQKQKLVADFGVTMHLAWAHHMPKGANHIN